MKDKTNKRAHKFYPYISAEVAFLGFIEDFKDFRDKKSSGVYLRNGPKDPTSGLRPREILGLVIMANMAMFMSGDIWAPGWLVGADEKPLPEDIAHDGAIRCTSGLRKGEYMHFEQAMATEVAHDASPEDIEAAILKEASRKSDKGEEYVQDTALIILVDYIGALGDLRKLSGSISKTAYKAIYLIGAMSENFKDFVCVTLKNLADTLGPVKLEFNRTDGKPDIARMQG